MLRCQSNEISVIIKYLLNENKKILVPIYFNKDNINEKKIINRLDMLILTVFVHNLLYGHQIIPEDLSIPFYGTSNPKLLPNPVYNSNGKNYVISTLKIIEGHARACEIDFILGLSYNYKLKPSVINKILKESSNIDPYELVLLILSDTLNMKFIDVFQIAQTCCDIALNPILDNNLNGQEWENVHPGWRFIRIVEALKKMNLKKGDLSDNDTISKRIIDCLEWPIPIKALVNWFNKDSFYIPYDNCIKSIRNKIPFILGNPLKYLNILSEKFPVSFGSMGMNKLTKDEQEIQQICREFFFFWGRIAMFLINGNLIDLHERNLLSKVNIYKQMKVAGIFDLDQLITNIEVYK
jgi:hypothetical protein